MKYIFLSYLTIVALLTVSLFQEPGLKESMERGREIYADFCVTCHLDSGEGVSYTFPPLANSDYLLQQREASIHAVKFGLQGEITVNRTVYNSGMAAMGLEDDEIADVLNYAMNSWGNIQEKMITEKEVAAIEK
ncbi:c-type cytochrome [Maribacter sp. X9]|uniref:c-type cytochrome n=1 Tax=Maribacter sp. X9 TaxID=3402159 RepID=UPI003AF3539B